MLIQSKSPIAASEITDPELFRQRRQIIKTLSLAGLVGMSPKQLFANPHTIGQFSPAKAGTDLTATSADIVKNYTNYYEFSFNKQDSTRLAQGLPTDPWVVEITGEVETPLKIHLEDILKQQVLQEYIYRFRCVEAWSMVVPWIGFPLVNLLKMAKPLASARFVQFTTLLDPQNMPNQLHSNMLEWPYREGLRIDEASHPLTIMAVGMYGETLPKQNGAPLRLVVPWKYGFKSIKAIVRIELVKKPPVTSWNQYAPQEYGFYANVNPQVAHPRWSQSSERLLGSRLFTSRRPTELFNGYGDQVAGMYSDMDLKHFF